MKKDMAKNIQEYVATEVIDYLKERDEYVKELELTKTKLEKIISYVTLGMNTELRECNYKGCDKLSLKRKWDTQGDHMNACHFRYNTTCEYFQGKRYCDDHIGDVYMILRDDDRNVYVCPNCEEEYRNNFEPVE